MSKMRPENIFLTVALSVIGVAAVSGYVAVMAQTYDPVDRIPTREEYAARVAAQETETEAVLDTLLTVPETEREPVEITPETEAAPVAPDVAEEEPEPADTDDTPETTLEEWFALLEERYAPRKYERETEADETTFDEWIAALEASFAAETKEPDPTETTFDEWLAMLDLKYPIDGSVPVRSTYSDDSGSSGGGASISWGVSSTSGPFVDIKTDENSSVTVIRTEDGYSYGTTWSDGEGNSSFAGVFVGSLPDDFSIWDNEDEDVSRSIPESGGMYIYSSESDKIHVTADCPAVANIKAEHYRTTDDPSALLDGDYSWCNTPTCKNYRARHGIGD